VRRGYTDDIAGTREKLSYNLYYLRHRSLLLDLVIVAKTASIVVRGWGAR
jgi:lipopolysaccharide/colanic/teichoic acid biosynthesis glycosyltransferase